MSSLKQGNLFSFFAKKKPAAEAAGSTSASAAAGGPSASSAAAAAATNSTSANSSANSNNNSTNANNTNSNSNNNSNNNGDGGEVTATRSTHPRGAQSSKQAALLAKVHVGCTVAVYWPDDAEYYPARVRLCLRSSDILC